MAIEFVCSSCSRPYRVKDELAGKTAKCGKCGSRMQIPQAASTGGATAPRPASAQAATGQAATSQAATRSSAHGAAGTRQPASRPAAARQAANGAAARQAAAPSAARRAEASTAASSDVGSWMDEELTAAPVAPRKSAARQVTCSKCGKEQPTGGVICGSCGEILPVESTVSNRPLALKPLPAKSDVPSKKGRKRKIKVDFQLGSLGALIRGTALCVAFTFVGATMWAVVAFLTNMEFGIIAIAMGGLAGYGMALGNSDNGFLAGVIAGFVSLCGIVVAKILIVVIVIAALVAGAAGGALGDLQREVLIQSMAQEALQQHGGNPANISIEQQERAVATARAKVDAMDDAQVEETFRAMEARWEAEAEAAEAAAIAAAEADGNNEADGNDEAVANEGAAEADAGPLAPVAVDDVEIDAQPIVNNGPGIGGIFRPIDLLFVLLAVGTAFKVGSGSGD